MKIIPLKGDRGIEGVVLTDGKRDSGEVGALSKGIGVQRMGGRVRCTPECESWGLREKHARQE